ncbi:MAG: alpha/beta fold hydrolase, partial [Myxococcales bacterium]
MSDRPFKEGYARGPGGIRLYYRVDGEEGLPLVCANGIGVSTFFWEPFAFEMRRKYRVVRFDYRGHGRSDSPRDPSDISIATCVADEAAVMDALGIDRAVLLGHSMGSQVGFEFYRAHPERVLALVPTLGPYRRAIETFMDSSLSLSAFAVMKAVVGAAPSMISRTMRPILLSGVAEVAARKLGIVDGALAPKRLMLEYMEHMTRLDLRSYLVL